MPIRNDLSRECPQLKWLLRALARFEEIWAEDTEFISRPGERNDVVCLCAVELRSGRTLRLFREKLDALGGRPPFRADSKAVHIGFQYQAEASSYLALGWPIPRNIIDLSPIFRCLTNGKETPEGKGLIGMQRYYGLDAISTKRKDAMRDRILKGWPFMPEERGQILDYGLTDVTPLFSLLALTLPQVDLRVALHWGEFAGVSALMQHHGVPTDTEIQPKLADEDIWRGVRDDMVPQINAAFDVYVRDSRTGDWSWSMERFRAYCARDGIDWPTRCNEMGQPILDMRRKTFENMTRGFKQLEPLRQLRHTRDKMRRIKLAVGRDGRNRTVLWPFKSKTGRTQPKAAEWIFSPAVWLRSLIEPGPGMAVAYVDWSSMEFMLAASLSDGHCGPVNNMLDMYNSGDPYLAFAKSVGAVPPSATKTSHEGIRENYKVMLLSTQYGLSAQTLAARLKISEIEAHEMLAQHRSQFAQYWAWSDDYIQHAMQTGIVQTVMGWTYHIGIVGQINERSLRNWPIQSAGADILRIACVIAARHGIKILAPVHDAVLIEAPIDQIEADVALMQEIVRRASRVVLNKTADGTHELRTDAKIIKYPKRYTDKRGDAIWGHVLELLAKQEQAKKRSA